MDICRHFANLVYVIWIHFIAQYRRSTLLKFWHFGPFFVPRQPEFWSKFNSFSYFGKGSPGQHSCEVWMELALWFRRSSHLKEIVDATQQTTNNTHSLITIAHHEHFMLRWAKKLMRLQGFNQKLSKSLDIKYRSRSIGQGACWLSMLSRTLYQLQVKVAGKEVA